MTTITAACDARHTWGKSAEVVRLRASEQKLPAYVFARLQITGANTENGGTSERQSGRVNRMVFSAKHFGFANIL